MKRINVINIQIPDLSTQNKEDNSNIFELLGQLKNLKKINSERLESNNKDGLSPILSLTKIFSTYPKISFEVNQKDNDTTWEAGNLVYGFNLPNKSIAIKRNITDTDIVSTETDKIGNYTMLVKNGHEYFTLTPKQFLNRFDGKLTELNHSGMNFGPEILAKNEYHDFKKLLSKGCNLYDYPTGDEWPFIIPSTEKEFTTEILNTEINRNPKYEIVYSHYHSKPLIQFDVETRLTKSQVLELLPDPYGISYQGLDKIFRSVFIYAGWTDVLLRFDIRFKSSRKDFAYWIVKKGHRISLV